MGRHRVLGRKFGRKTKHRIAMKRNLVSSLIEHGRIVTTIEKAKEYKAAAEKIITLGREKTLHRIRLAAVDIHQKDILRKLFDDVGPRMKDRPGGYTRIRKLAKRRLNDGASQCILELVDYAPPRPVTAEEAEAAATAEAPAKGKKKKDAPGHEGHDHGGEGHDHDHDHGKGAASKKAAKAAKAKSPKSDG